MLGKTEMKKKKNECHRRGLQDWLMCCDQTAACKHHLECVQQKCCGFGFKFHGNYEGAMTLSQM
jgi:hypothetical protein